MIDDTEQTPPADAAHELTPATERPETAAANPASAGEPHPAHALLSRIEAEVDGMLHSPLALANWVKSMVAEARKLL